MKHSDIGVEVYPGTSDQTLLRTWPFALGFVFRRNKLESHAGIRIYAAADNALACPQIQDVIVEENTICHTDVGLQIGSVQPGEVSGPVSGVLVRNNVFDDVDTQMAGDRLIDALIL